MRCYALLLSVLTQTVLVAFVAVRLLVVCYQRVRVYVSESERAGTMQEGERAHNAGRAQLSCVRCSVLETRRDECVRRTGGTGENETVSFVCSDSNVA